MSILQEICDRKRVHIQERQDRITIDCLKEKIKKSSSSHCFLKKIKENDHVALIAEIKKASPSGGVIRSDFEPAALAEIYEESGASCLSVLTDEPYFQGQDSYIGAVKQVVSLPVLRKDFIVDPYQIYETKALGADCLLLIMAALSDDEATAFHALAQELGLDVLVEVHDRAELERALKIKGVAMIGINNRNLKTLEVNINTALELAEHIPAGIVSVGESGIKTRDDVKALESKGFDAMLVGESLMRQADLAAATRSLLE